jgi:CubicO group peptidase (beta-lactamase class C family)
MSMQHTRLAGWATVQRSIVLTLFMSLAFVPTPSKAADARTDEAFSKAANEAVDRVAREDGFSGVILVARGDQVLLRRAVGLADRSRNIPNTPETRFPLGSVTKQFTAAAIMLLVEDGKVSLADPISKYFPISKDFVTSPPGWKDVTIKHLLTHSSGITDRSVSQSSSALSFAPGTDYEYANTGYWLLTGVIEKASGQSFGEFLRARIFAKLGMNDTSNMPRASDAVLGYVRSSDGQPQTGEPLDPTNISGDGSILSTLDDMLVWSRSLDTDTVLSASTRAAVFTDYGHGYGFGWRLSPKYGRSLIWHTGLLPGFASILDLFPEEHLTVVAMTNSTAPTGSTATLVIEGKATTFPANASRKLVEEVERLYFGRTP